jgi:hypothetical protein
MKLNRVQIYRSFFMSFGNLSFGRVLSEVHFVRIKWTELVKNKEVLHEIQSWKKETRYIL